MPTSLIRQGSNGNVLFAILSTLSLCGLVGMVLAIVVGFEEPNDLLLLTSAVLMFAAPVGVLGHLWVTKSLTAAEKRAWVRHFTSNRAANAFSIYLTAPDRRTALAQLTKPSSDRCSL
jgi:hypothetical protein